MQSSLKILFMTVRVAFQLVGQRKDEALKGALLLTNTDIKMHRGIASLRCEKQDYPTDLCAKQQPY